MSDYDRPDGVHHTHDLVCDGKQIGVLYSYVGGATPWHRAVESLDGQVRFHYSNDPEVSLRMALRKNFGLEDGDKRIIQAFPRPRRTPT